jgi:hypothetical protein
MNEIAGAELFILKDFGKIYEFTRRFDSQLDYCKRLLAAMPKNDKGIDHPAGEPSPLWADTERVTISLEQSHSPPFTTIKIHNNFGTVESGHSMAMEIREASVPTFNPDYPDTSDLGVAITMDTQLTGHAKHHWFALSTEFPLDDMEKMAEFIKNHGQKQNPSPPLERQSNK